MRIGNKRVKGFSKRFWLIIGGVILLFILMFTLWPSEEQVDPLVAPAFSTEKLSQLQPNWIEKYISAYGLRKPESEETAFLDNYSLNVGQPFKFQAYIPTEEASQDRPSLRVEKFGWTFVPAVFLSPIAPITQNDYEALEEQVNEGTPVVLGFPSGEVPSSGLPYEVTSLLYWNTDVLNPPSDEESEAGFSTSPVLLVASARAVSPAELSSPTTHVADLDISYSSGNYRLDLKHLEWSSGREVRLCIALTNIGSNRALTRWYGTDGFRAEYPQGTGQGQSLAVPNPDSSLATQESIDFNATVSGYILFENSPASDPSQPITLFVPSLTSGVEGTPTRVTVMPDQFQNVAVTDKNANGNLTDSGC